MEKHSFYFKQFSVRHDHCSMKVGTDAVLLGAWTSVSNAENILEIGAGSGVIALMLAQRTDNRTKIEAIEIAEADAAQARENIAMSPWPEKITVLHTPVQQFFPGRRYDLIVSNPPFFVNSSSPPSKTRIQSRHTEFLTHEELLQSVKNLLTDDGRFSVVLPKAEGDLFQKKARDYGLACSRRTAFYSRKDKPQERWLMEFSKNVAEKRREDSLILYSHNSEWTNDYNNLMKAFYLAAV